MQVGVRGVMLVLVVSSWMVVVRLVSKLLVHVLLLVLWVMLLVMMTTRWRHLMVMLLQLRFGKAPTLVLALQGSSSERRLLLLVVPQDVGLRVACHLVFRLPLLF